MSGFCVGLGFIIIVLWFFGFEPWNYPKHLIYWMVGFAWSFGVEVFELVYYLGMFSLYPVTGPIIFLTNKLGVMHYVEVVLHWANPILQGVWVFMIDYL